MNAFVTGGSRGIGAATVRLLCQTGRRVAFTYLHSEEAARTLEEQTGAMGILCDTSVPDDVSDAFSQAEARLGFIEEVVANAGISQFRLLTEITDADWRQMMGVNLDGPFYLARTCLPRMISEKRGSIVFVSSMWGQVGASCEAHYSAAKAGLIGLGKALAKEVGPSNVRVNCICPGVIATDMNARLDPETMAALKEETPLMRVGSAQEVARAIEYLLGDKASFVTGQVLGVNGGFVI